MRRASSLRAGENAAKGIPLISGGRNIATFAKNVVISPLRFAKHEPYASSDLGAPILNCLLFFISIFLQRSSCYRDRLTLLAGKELIAVENMIGESTPYIYIYERYKGRALTLSFRFLQTQIPK